MERVTVVIPIHNERDNLVNLSNCLTECPQLEVIVVDSNSTDNPTKHLPPYVKYFRSQVQGRGAQIAYGIKHTTRPWIWIVHADTTISLDTFLIFASLLDQPQWGCFNVRLNQRGFLYRVIETMMNFRSRITGICTGDQGIFFHRELLNQIGGFPDIPLMEDIELSKRLKRLQDPIRIPAKIVTSARKWANEGVLKTIVKMMYFRLRYFLGASPRVLYKKYYPQNKIQRD